METYTVLWTYSTTDGKTYAVVSIGSGTGDTATKICTVVYK